MLEAFWSRLLLLVVTDAFWSLFPDVRIRLVVAGGFDNTRARADTRSSTPARPRAPRG